MGLRVSSPQPPAHLVLEGVCILKLSLKGQPVSTLRWHLVWALLGPGQQVTAEWLSGCACTDFRLLAVWTRPMGVTAWRELTKPKAVMQAASMQTRWAVPPAGRHVCQARSSELIELVVERARFCTDAPESRQRGWGVHTWVCANQTAEE